MQDILSKRNLLFGSFFAMETNGRRYTCTLISILRLEIDYVHLHVHVVAILRLRNRSCFCCILHNRSSLITMKVHIATVF